MNLTLLAGIEVCPECGAEAIAEGVRASIVPRRVFQHCNGQRTEWRRFICGYECEWSPNFHRVEPARNSQCCASEEYAAREAKRNAAARAVAAFIGSLDIDDEYRGILVSRLP